MYCCYIFFVGAGAATTEFVVGASEFTFHSSLFLGRILILIFLFSWTQAAREAAAVSGSSSMAPGCIGSNPSVGASQCEKTLGPRAHKEQPWCSSLRVTQQKMDRKPVMKPS